MQHAGLLIAIHRAQFGPAQRQFTIGARTILVNFNVERAVHRLDIVGVIVNFHGRIHAFAVEVKMAAGLPEQSPADMGSIEQLVAMRVMGVLPEGLNHMPNPRSVGMPANQTGADLLVRAEQLHLSPDAAMVALLGLLNAIKIRLQILLVRKSSAINALQHRILLVAAEIRPGDRQELDRPNLAAVLNVRAAAQIQEVADLVQADDFAFGNIIQPGQLKRLPQISKFLMGFLAGHFHALERQLAPQHLAHFLLNLFQILGRQTMRHVKVVVEALFGGRPNVKLGIGKQFLHCRGHDMRRTVAHRL